MRYIAFLSILLLIPACSPNDDKNSEIIHSPTREEFVRLIENNDVVLVDFQAEWCGPCKTMTPIIRSLERDYRGQVKVVEVDIDKRRDLAGAFDVDSIPRFIVFRKGQVDRVLNGVKPRQELVNALESALKKS